MILKICMALVLLSALNASCQVEPSATGGAAQEEVDVPMNMPPPVNGASYPSQVGSAERQDYVSLGISVNAGYNSNVLPGLTGQPISDEVYSFLPLFNLSKETPRQTLALNYNSGYTVFQHTSTLNYMDQGITGLLTQRFTRHVTLSLNDSFVQASGIFNQPGALPGGSISGSVSASSQVVLAPYANELLNSSNAALTDQFAKDTMVGGSFITQTLRFPNPSQADGLDNMQSYGGTAFLNRRASDKQYVGAIYEYLRTTTDPVVSTTEGQTIYGYLTYYFNRTASLSLAAGPERITTTAPGVPTYQSWEPAANVSLGWQAGQANLAASYARSAGAAGGLPGAYTMDTANLAAAWQPNREWTASASGSYALYKSLTPQLGLSFPGGHTVSGSVALQRTFNAQFSAQVGYMRLHESYSGVPVIEANPDSDEVYATITYQFSRPIGR